MLYNVIWGRVVVKNMTLSRYIIYGWPFLGNVFQSLMITVRMAETHLPCHAKLVKSDTTANG